MLINLSMFFEPKQPEQKVATTLKAMSASKIVMNGEGAVIGVAGSQIRPTPMFDAEGRLVGFDHQVG